MNSELGRWDSVDPIGYFGGSANLYRYESDAAVSKLDPMGLCDQPATPIADDDPVLTLLRKCGDAGAYIDKCRASNKNVKLCRYPGLSSLGRWSPDSQTVYLKAGVTGLEAATVLLFELVRCARNSKLWEDCEKGNISRQAYVDAAERETWEVLRKVSEISKSCEGAYNDTAMRPDAGAYLPGGDYDTADKYLKGTNPSIVSHHLGAGAYWDANCKAAWEKKQPGLGTTIHWWIFRHFHPCGGGWK